MTKKDELKKRLSPEAYAVTQDGATEPPFTGKYYKNHDRGMYTCIVCGQELFSSDAKFDSGSGWPSFDRAVEEGSIAAKLDTNHGPTSPDGYEGAGMIRTEITCTNCGAHLGHLFDDGPAETTGQRYCINSCALNFDKDPSTS